MILTYLIIVYYRVLIHYKTRFQDKSIPGTSIEEVNKQFYQTIINLKDKLRSKKSFLEQRRATKKAIKARSF